MKVVTGQDPADRDGVIQTGRLEAVIAAIGHGAGYLIWAMILLLLLSVVARYLAVPGLAWTTEMASLLYGAYFLIGGLYAFQRGQHIVVDAFISKADAHRRAWLYLVTAPVVAVFAVVLAWQSAGFAARSVSRWETSASAHALPVWPVNVILFVVACGLVLLTIRNVIGAVRTVRGGRRRHAAAGAASASNSTSASAS